MLSYRPRRRFDVTSKSDLNIYKKYVTTQAWGSGGCPFELEEPWTNVPAMLSDKIVWYHITGKTIGVARS